MSNSLAKKRVRAFKCQDGKCFYCGVPMWENNADECRDYAGLSPKLKRRIRCTAEHLEARVDGGSDAYENLVAACWFCNQLRHRRPTPLGPKRYRKLVRARMRARKWHPVEIHKMLEATCVDG